MKYVPVLLDNSIALSELVSKETNGLGRLADAVSAEVTEELNGSYTAEIEYPVDGQHFSEILLGSFIKMTANEISDPQIFEVVEVSKPIDGIVTFQLNHISYELSKTSVNPFSSYGVYLTLRNLKQNMIGCDEFTFESKQSEKYVFLQNKAPQSARSFIGGQERSFIDVTDCEIEWDNTVVKFYDKRGNDNGIEIVYGKNLVDVKQEENIENMYTHVIPYVIDPTTEEVIFGNTKQLSTSGRSRYLNLDLSDEFGMEDGTIPDVISIDDAADIYIENNNIQSPKVSLSVSFVHLWDTEEYKNVAPLENVGLGDTITVSFPMLNVKSSARVTKTVWDALACRYTSIDLGDSVETLTDQIADTEKETENKIEDQKFSLLESIKHATDVITGATNGFIRFGFDEAGYPSEIFAMDTNDVATAKKVIRINYEGIGGSTTGIDGDYNLAILNDGAKIVAEQIAAGTIKGVSLQFGTENPVTVSDDPSGNGVLFSGDGNITFDSNQMLDIKNRFLDSEVIANEFRIQNYIGEGTSQNTSQIQLWTNYTSGEEACGLFMYGSPSTASLKLHITMSENDVIAGFDAITDQTESSARVYSGYDENYLLLNGKKALLRQILDNGSGLTGYIITGRNTSHMYYLDWDGSKLHFYVDGTDVGTLN